MKKMENELEKTSKLKVLLESIVKIVANGQHPVLGIGANLYFDYQNALLTTELALGTIDCNPAHNWHDAVLLLTSVRVEQY